MAKIHVEEDWSKETDENPFLSGGMINIEGELIYVFLSQPPTPPPPQSEEEAEK